MKRSELDITTFTDYRCFLAERLSELKRQDRKYSLQYFTRKLGLGSRNYLRMVVCGERNLSLRLAERLGEVLGLDERQHDVFLLLVRFAQEGDTGQKNEILRELRKNKRFLDLHKLALDRLDYLADPLLLTLREMAPLDDFTEDPAVLAKRIKGKVSARQVASGLKKLIEMGLLVRSPEGRLVQAHRHQDSGEQLGSVPLRTYHKNMLEQAIESIDGDPTTRHLTGISLSMSEQGYRKSLEQLDLFLDALRRIAEEDPAPDRVLHLEMALYPLTKITIKNDRSSKTKKGVRS